MMRLYLTVIRNELPLVKTVWPITEEQTQQTIAQLIGSINQHFPLDGEHWGLEDYVLMLAGFECLHYHTIDHVLQNGDEVTVRPLRDGELRSRTVSGRNSISASGRHLYDGVAFGGQPLRGPARSDVVIPPRKRRRVSFEGQPDLLQIEDVPQDDSILRRESQSPDYEYESTDRDSVLSESSDADFEDDDKSHGEDSNHSASVDLESDIADSGDSSDDSSSESETSTDNDQDSDEDESSGSGSDASDDDSSDSADSSSGQGNVSDTSWTGLEGSSDLVKQSGGKQAIARTSMTTMNASGKNVLMRDVANESAYTNGVNPADVDAGQDEAIAVINTAGNASHKSGIPHDGTPSTVRRNLRRRQSQKLKRLKQDGILDASATFHDLIAYEASNNQDDYTARLEQKRQELIKALANGGVDVTPETVPVEDESPPDVESSKPDHRARLDIASSKRLVFGSLGVRVPRNAGEEEVTRKRLAAQLTVKERLQMLREKRVNGVVSDTVYDTTKVAEDNDSWMDKINLRAVECCDTSITLSTPPFPFKQRWDPQFRGRKRKQAQAAVTPTYDGYNDEGDYLDYDDPEDAVHSVNNDLAVTSETFPPLPDKLDILPLLKTEQPLPGDFIVDTRLECNAETGWEPAFQTRTYRLVDQTGEGVWNVDVAPRDMPKINFDAEGSRVYSMHEVPGGDENDELDKEQLLDLTSCPDARLLFRPV